MWEGSADRRKLSRCASDCSLNVSCGSVQTLGKIKLQREAGVPLAIVGGHQLQARNLHELAFQWRGYVVGHRFWRRARVIYLHLDDRVVNSRQITR
jgi:hypothetical protein